MGRATASIALFTLIATLTVAGAASAAELNIALNRSVSVSATYLNFIGANAVDGDTTTVWNSGGYDGNWIEIDLGTNSAIQHLHAKVAQVPDGTPTFTLTGRTSGGTTIPLGSFSGPVHDGQWIDIFNIDFTLVHYVRVTTTNTNSWVGWYEIRVAPGFVNPAKTTSWGRVKSLYR